ncbi:MAG: PTPA-CTERM sorting domain-containing protein [Leptolyngbyaceae cyanobacterium SM2_5_2]|nr:PTPA-CTERM sorting domain-containing protein [Leptolyngbyaceae cyanobacterium SM2_5_2]
MSQAPMAKAATPYGPSPYTQFSDSPFSGIDFTTDPDGYFHLEDFEDGALDTPGVTASAGFVLPGLPGNTLTDSVDGDDGSVDGSGSAGTSFYSNNNKVLRFTFDASVLGKLPSHVGIVWTDVGFVDGDTPPTFTGRGDVVFRAYNAGNQLLKNVIAKNLGDGLANGGIAEDRFFGIRYYPGIAHFEIEMPNSGDWEVDHLQYGYVPTPALLPGLIGLGVAALRKKQEKSSESA